LPVTQPPAWKIRPEGLVIWQDGERVAVIPPHLLPYLLADLAAWNARLRDSPPVSDMSAATLPPMPLISNETHQI
jgi:hypothetical protein